MKNIAIVSESIEIATLSAIRKLKIPIIQVSKNPNTYEQVSSHPDMNVMIIKNRMYTCDYFYKQYGEIFEAMGYEVVNVGKLGMAYPDNIKTNYCVLDKYIIGKLDQLHVKIKDNHSDEFEFIDVKQGYAKCSCVLVDGRSIITGDLGIYNKLKTADLDVLLISDDGVILKGFNKGFLGGATGSVDDYVFFNGDVTKHKDYHAIKGFIEERHKSILMIHDKDLEDIGTIIFAKDLRRG